MIEGLPTSLTLEIVTPDHALVTDRVDEVEIPGSEGYFGVLPGHTPFLSTLAIGEMWYRKGGEKFFLSLAGGFAEVLPGKVTILAEIAERAEDIDITRAERAKQRAQDWLAAPPATLNTDFERARIAMLKSLIRLQVATRARTRG